MFLLDRRNVCAGSSLKCKFTTLEVKQVNTDHCVRYALAIFDDCYSTFYNWVSRRMYRDNGKGVLRKVYFYLFKRFRFPGLEYRYWHVENIHMKEYTLWLMITYNHVPRYKKKLGSTVVQYLHFFRKIYNLWSITRVVLCNDKYSKHLKAIIIFVCGEDCSLTEYTRIHKLEYFFK